MHAYMDSIRFGTEDTPRNRGSPYDLFLHKNNLPTKQSPGESQLAYADRLLLAIRQLDQPKWVSVHSDGDFKLHNQDYRFEADELAGLRIFLAREPSPGSASGSGNCVVCHTPPLFTDHSFHNTGISQSDYDAVFGAGSFVALQVPNFHDRLGDHDAYLPATRMHPRATDRFRSLPSKDKPGFADLGMWNIFANPDFPKPQASLRWILCSQVFAIDADCAPHLLLPHTIGLFKTPSVRDLGHSQPYFHSGSSSSIEAVLIYYSRASSMARANTLRNASPELARIRLSERDRRFVAAFLRSLNEDYH